MNFADNTVCSRSIRRCFFMESYYWQLLQVLKKKKKKMIPPPGKSIDRALVIC